MLTPEEELIFAAGEMLAQTCDEVLAEERRIALAAKLLDNALMCIYHRADYADFRLPSASDKLWPLLAE